MPSLNKNALYYKKNFTPSHLGWKLRCHVETASQHNASDLQEIKDMIAAGADLNICDNDGYGDIDYTTPLLFAVRASHLELARLLLESGAEITPGSWGETALTKAASNGCLPMIQLLKKHGVDLDEVSWMAGYSCLMTAAAEGHIEIVAYLLAQDVDITIATRVGATALTLAEDKGHTEVVNLIKKHALKKNSEAVLKALGNTVKDPTPLKRPKLIRRPKPPGKI